MHNQDTDIVRRLDKLVLLQNSGNLKMDGDRDDRATYSALALRAIAEGLRDGVVAAAHDDPRLGSCYAA